MKVQALQKFGDHTVFEALDIPKPIVKAGHVLIKVVATSVNPIDYKIRAGRVPAITAAFPAILHSDVAGIIEEVGDEVTKFKIGDEVYGCAGGVINEGGALGEWMLADANLIAKKPKSLTMAEAAALPLVGITAWEALFEKIKIVKGQKILIHGGAGGVGHIAIQLAKWAGATVYATVSSAEKAKLALSFGATDTINYKTETVQSYVERLTDGEGFSLVLDTVGGETIDHSLAAVAKYGDVVTIQAGATHDLTPLFLKSANLHVVFMLVPLIYNIQRSRHGDILQRLAELVDSGAVKPFVDPQRFSFEEVGKAHAFLESGKALGKVVISR